MKKNPIYVTKPFLPPFPEVMMQLQKIWNTKQLTNNGPLQQELEEKLKTYLGVKHLFFVSNGTIAIQIALKVLNIQKEVITTPFSYVATTTAVLWEKCTPVFSDIDSETCCLDPKRIEEKITANTEAILGVHVYGQPCHIEAIEHIAKKHNLKVIYDGAHAFGTLYKGKSLLSYGDITTVSFHATKLFNTAEGGAIITNDDTLAEKISLFRSFGHIGDTHILPGINGKNSEFHAAIGLALLPYVELLRKRRKKLSLLYTKLLTNTPVTLKHADPYTTYNYAYYPVLFESEAALLTVKEALEKNNIFPRRYFYPSLNTLPYVTKKPCPISESISQRMLCLPLFPDLKAKDVFQIVEIIKDALHVKVPLKHKKTAISQTSALSPQTSISV